jgi:hypothetical protein
MDYGAWIVAIVMGILIGGLTVVLWKLGTGDSST